ncbi:hypothetical protein DPX16_3498 [Anabarilius grahami]|uniref:Uncharacterized protein n=1 Tax=Anabarilius grahami TaxID=495550 RepID=A0A3N0Y7P3_ANAGA|nr:hypothetical protein DPX16_3498 [Anabarilius grahami]
MARWTDGRKKADEDQLQPTVWNTLRERSRPTVGLACSCLLSCFPLSALANSKPTKLRLTSNVNNIPGPLSTDIKIPESTLQSNHSFSLEEARKIKAETKGQASRHKEWHKKREGMLTASNFGKIIKRKKVTEEFIQSSYFPKPFAAKATSYGTANEPRAKQLYQEEYPNWHIHDAGLMLQSELHFLGATPDPIICDESGKNWTA